MCLHRACSLALYTSFCCRQITLQWSYKGHIISQWHFGTMQGGIQLNVKSRRKLRELQVLFNSSLFNISWNSPEPNIQDSFHKWAQRMCQRSFHHGPGLGFLRWRGPAETVCWVITPGCVLTTHPGFLQLTWNWELCAFGCQCLPQGSWNKLPASCCFVIKCLLHPGGASTPQDMVTINTWVSESSRQQFKLSYLLWQDLFGMSFVFGMLHSGKIHLLSTKVKP